MLDCGVVGQVLAEAEVVVEVPCSRDERSANEPHEVKPKVDQHRRVLRKSLVGAGEAFT